MEAQGPRTEARRGWILALVAVGAVGAIFLAGALLDLGPFKPNPLSATDFRLRADEICADAHAQYAALQRRPPKTAAASAALTSKLVDIAQAELGELSSLDAPSEERAALDRYLTAREHAIAILQRGEAAAVARDGAAYSRAQGQLAATQAHRQRLARAAGFRECSAPIASRRS